VVIARTITAALVLLMPAHAGAGDGAAEILRRLDPQTPGALERASRALAALGPSAMGELFALVSPAAVGPQDELLARSFRLQPKSELHAFLSGFTSVALRPERLKPALLVLREAGSGHELARCLELAGPDVEALQAELVAALTAICARDPAACDRALALACKAQAGEAESLVRGLAEAHSGPAALALARLAEERPQLSNMALSSLLAEAERLPRPLDVDLQGALRDQLAREDHPAAQQLLLLAGRLEDDESVPLLIKRLGGARTEQRENALWSLRRITGLGLGPDASAWSDWFEDELRWWRERAPAVMQLLRAAEAAGQRLALGELGQRYWRRQQVSDELAEYLAQAPSAGARMACGVLARLGRESAIPALQARLEDADREVRESARTALASLTGKKIPSRAVALAGASSGAVPR